MLAIASDVSLTSLVESFCDHQYLWYSFESNFAAFGMFPSDFDRKYSNGLVLLLNFFKSPFQSGRSMYRRDNPEPMKRKGVAFILVISSVNLSSVRRVLMFTLLVGSMVFLGEVLVRWWLN